MLDATDPEVWAIGRAEERGGGTGIGEGGVDDAGVTGAAGTVGIGIVLPSGPGVSLPPSSVIISSKSARASSKERIEGDVAPLEPTTRDPVGVSPREAAKRDMTDTDDAVAPSPFP